MIEFQINKPPSDGITSLEFAPRSSEFLLASSWDSSVSLYNVNSNERIQYYKHECPVLSSCFIRNEQNCCSAGSDGNIILKNIETNKKSNLVLIGEHQAPIKTCKFNDNHNILITGSWDTTIQAFNPNLSNFSSTNQIASLKHSGKIFAMDLISDHKIAVVTSNNDVYIWDLRYLKTPAIKRKVTLANQIRDICSFPKTSGKEGFVCCSTEGRAAVEFIDSISSKLQDKFAFKCHREKKQVPLQETNSSGSVPQEVIYPVNSLAFSPKHHTFATAGSDGFVNVWDPFSKKRIYQLPKYPVGVVEVAFGNSLKDKSVLAIACSYNYELDENPVEVPSDRIYIRHLEESDIARSVKS